jgi:hypothetical protein
MTNHSFFDTNRGRTGLFTKAAAGFIIASALAFAGCAAGGPGLPAGPAPVVHTETAARLVSHATAGLIGAGEPVRVRFQEGVLPRDITAAPPGPEVFRFSPAVKGTARWEDSRTLAFVPAEKLTPRRSYSAVVDISAITGRRLPEGGTGPAELSLGFAVRGREIENLETDLSNPEPAKPEVLRLTGSLIFSDPTDLETLRKAARLSVAGRPMALKWSEGRNQREFLFTGENIERLASRQELSLTLDKKILGLSASFEKKEIVEAKGVFSLIDVRPTEKGRTGSYKLVFSDELSGDQDIRGLVTVEPPVPTTLRKVGKAIFINGDFKPGEKYRLTAAPGIRSRWGNGTTREEGRDILPADLKPEISFAQSGVFLPTTGDRKIYFKTVNLRRARVEVTRVFENNLAQFLQTEQLSSNRVRNQEFDSYSLSRVGVTAASEVLEIGEDRNIPRVSELDLRKLIPPGDKGLHIVSLTFEKKDMIWDFEEDSERRDYYGDEYYTNPSSWGYVWMRGRVYKPVMVSDIGLTWKAGKNTHTVYVTDLLSALPTRGASVGLRTYQNQTIAEGYTDNEGKITFSGVGDEAFFIVAERGGMRSVLKTNEMAWNLASFDTGGTEATKEGLTAYLYTDRGVYRPGDDIRLSALIRNKEGTFPENHPVSLKITDPRGVEGHRETLTAGSDGFYAFTVPTREDGPTGIYKAEVTAGGSTFTTNLRVETVVPNRLKVVIETDPKTLLPGDRNMNIRLSSNYLFGAPAAGLAFEAGMTVLPRTVKSPNHPGFSFIHEGTEYPAEDRGLAEGTLDEKGRAEIRYNWTTESFGEPPSGLYFQIHARVLEKGGRSVRETNTVSVDPYRYYVGLQKPDLAYGYAQIGTEVSVPCVVIDAEGKTRPGKNITYRIYKNNRYWWWEYDSVQAFRVRYKTDAETVLVGEGTLVSRSVPGVIKFTPEAWGEYFIEAEVKEVDEKQAGRRGSGGDFLPGHRAGFFFRASSWGDQVSGEDEGMMALSPDRKTYYPGDRAKITLTTPPEGYLLVTVEKGDGILSSSWRRIEGTETVLDVPVTSEMIPNAYVAVSLIQPHGRSSNDRPLRMYGIAPLAVEDPATRENLSLKIAGVLAPNKEFTVELATGSRSPAQVTVAVVDEGLLDLTRFATPDAWKSFYAKQRLGVVTLDLFSQVIGSYKEDIFKTFSIGGAEEAKLMAELAAELAAKKEDSRVKRFKPVALFSGIVKTDDRGTARVSFTMPNYMGSVRVMAVSAKGAKYGSAETTVPVRSAIIMLPTLPRVLGPEEKIRVPVTLFTLAEGIGTVSVEAAVEGPVRLVGPAKREISVEAGSERDLFFELETLPAIGPARITLTARGGSVETREVTDITVRASSPPLARTEQVTLRPGERRTFSVEAGGLPGTNRTTLKVLRRGDLKLGHRLSWLIRYPYGCIEQITSAALPQLYLSEFIPGSGGKEKEIDRNIDAAIEGLKRFAVPAGGFAYWPGNSQVSAWGTNYAGHFLLEARSRGYRVDQGLLDRWIRYQNSAALAGREDMMTRIYRLYLLAKAGRPAIGPMNLIKENSLKDLTDVEKWLLGAAYYLAGVERTAFDIIQGAGIDPPKYAEFGGTYGSDLRDRAMILEAAMTLRMDDTADRLFDVTADHISGSGWYSTQSLGFSLLSAGKYLAAVKRSETPVLSGAVVLPSGERVPFSTTGHVWSLDLPETRAPRQEVTVTVDGNVGVSRVFALLEWEGQPLVSRDPEVKENLALETEWLDDDGNPVDPAALEQGREFWAKITLSRTTGETLFLEELALTRMLPSGWEPVNTRLTGEELPKWSAGLPLGKPKYADIRDDGFSWFFDMAPRTRKLVFLAKIQAVTEGTFTLPPATAGTMYRNDYQAVLPGGTVRVRGRE